MAGPEKPDLVVWAALHAVPAEHIGAACHLNTAADPHLGARILVSSLNLPGAPQVADPETAIAVALDLVLAPGLVAAAAVEPVAIGLGPDLAALDPGPELPRSGRAPKLPSLRRVPKSPTASAFLAGSSFSILPGLVVFVEQPALIHGAFRLVSLDEFFLVLDVRIGNHVYRSRYFSSLNLLGRECHAAGSRRAATL